MMESLPAQGAQESRILTRPVSHWIFRHFKADENERLIVDRARVEAAEAARTILENVESGEIIVFYGSGTAERHKESFKLLVGAVREGLDATGKNIAVFTPDEIRGSRRSLRSVATQEDLQFMPEEARGRELEYWLRTGDTLGGRIKDPARTLLRIRGLLDRLTRFCKGQLGSERVHWVFISSIELPGVILAEHFGIEDALKAGMKNGGWIRIDVPSQFSGKARLTHYSGLVTEAPIFGADKITP